MHGEPGVGKTALLEYHLHKVFAKLDISSRNQLHRAHGSDPGTAPPIGGTAAADA